MRDINDIMPKIKNMRWGALTNMPPTNQRVYYMDRIFPHNGRWHTVFEDKDVVTIDGKQVRKHNAERWT